MTPKHRLLGNYSTARFTFGSSAFCEVRGEVVITKLSSAPIPWPIGKRPGGRALSLVVYGDLFEALKRESATAICHWWGVTAQTVSKWRREVSIDQMTEGTRRLKAASAKASPGIAAALAKGWAKAQDPERRRKIAAARRGKPRPAHVIEAMRKGRAGKPQSEEARRKMSDAHKRRVRPPPKAWCRDEDGLLGEVPEAEVARRTRRSEKAVVARRKRLQVEFDNT